MLRGVMGSDQCHRKAKLLHPEKRPRIWKLGGHWSPTTQLVTTKNVSRNRQMSPGAEGWGAKLSLVGKHCPVCTDLERSLRQMSEYLKHVATKYFLYHSVYVKKNILYAHNCTNP